jgi:hypothetical protein
MYDIARIRKDVLLEEEFASAKEGTSERTFPRRGETSNLTSWTSASSHI